MTMFKWRVVGIKGIYAWGLKHRLIQASGFREFSEKTYQIMKNRKLSFDHIWALYHNTFLLTFPKNKKLRIRFIENK